MTYEESMELYAKQVALDLLEDPDIAARIRAGGAPTMEEFEAALLARHQRNENIMVRMLEDDRLKDAAKNYTIVKSFMAANRRGPEGSR